MKLNIKKLTVASSVALMAVASGTAFGQASIFSPQEGVNAIFVGVGSAPDFMGSDDGEAVPAIMARVHLGQSRRYVQLLGPQLSLNLIDSEAWSFGPQLVYRAKRDDDVDNLVVKQMRTVDSEVEFGAFVGRTWQLSSDKRHRFGLRADLGSGEGEFGTASANYFLPVGRVVFNFGGGLSYGSSKWTDNYFGVNGSDVALYPSRNGNAYKAGSGLYDYRLNVGVIYHISKNWHLGAGLRYSQLQGDAKDSPIVAEQGNNSQYIFGAAIGYAWQ